MRGELFKKLIDYLNDTELFVKEQLPDIFNQIILYGRIETAVSLIFVVIWDIFLYRVVKKLYLMTDEFGDIQLLPAIAIFAMALATIFFNIGAIVAISKLIQVWAAPKLYIISYLKGK